MSEMMAFVIPETETPFMLASLALAVDLYQAAGNKAAMNRLKKINAELLHQADIEPPSRYMAFFPEHERAR